MNRIEFYCIELKNTVNSTVSNLYADVFDGSDCLVESVFLCNIIEDGQRDKKIKGETRIPEGRFPIVKRVFGGFYTRYFNRWEHHFVMQIINIPDFTNVLVHTGNTVKNTDGCPLTNTGYKLNQNKNYSGTNSRDAYLVVWKFLKSYNFPDIMYWNVKRFNNTEPMFLDLNMSKVA